MLFEGTPPAWSKTALDEVVRWHNEFITDRVKAAGGSVSIDELERIARKADEIFGRVAGYLD